MTQIPGSTQAGAGHQLERRPGLPALEPSLPARPWSPGTRVCCVTLCPAQAPWQQLLCLIVAAEEAPTYMVTVWPQGKGAAVPGGHLPVSWAPAAWHSLWVSLPAVSPREAVHRSQVIPAHGPGGRRQHLPAGGGGPGRRKGQPVVLQGSEAVTTWAITPRNPQQLLSTPSTRKPRLEGRRDFTKVAAAPTGQDTNQGPDPKPRPCSRTSGCLHCSARNQP